MLTTFRLNSRRHSAIGSVLLLAIVGLVAVDGTGTAGVGTAGDARRGPRLVAPVAKVRKDSVPSEVAKVQSYIELTSRSLDKRIQNAIAKIDGTPRKLLALRTYLGLKSINGTWAWTNKEMAAYRRTLDFRVANAEVDKVIRLFQQTHRGYQLRSTKLARTLEDQIELWNKTSSVSVAGANLMKQTMKTLAAPAYPDTASSKSLKKFQSFLRNHAVGPVPTVSVPGLSDHGQLRAYDFIIWQADKIVAGSDDASIRNQWVGGSWGKRLRQIVYAASSRFEGPLASPNEPWHYTYIR